MRAFLYLPLKSALAGFIIPVRMRRGCAETLRIRDNGAACRELQIKERTGMSDRGDLQDVQEFVKVIISSLRIERDAIGETDAVGGILPNGINDVYLKVTLHDVSVEFEISSARAIHNSEPCTGIRRDIHVPPGGGAP